MQLIYVEWNYIYTGWRPVCVCVCMFKRKWLCVCVFWERGGGMGSNSYTLASRAAVQSAPGFPGNALIKPACRRFAVQSTHASWGLYLENQKKEHFTVSPLQSWKYNSHQLACLFLFGIYTFFLPFHARIVLQKKKDKKETPHSSSDSVTSSCVKTLQHRFYAREQRRISCNFFLCISLSVKT